MADPEDFAAPSLEPVTRVFLDSLAGTVFEDLGRLGIPEARAAFARLQDSVRIPRLPALLDDLTLPVGPSGAVAVRLFRPEPRNGPLPLIVHCHGGGGFMGGADTHDHLLRELAVGARAVVCCVEFTLVPEATRAQQVEEVYAALLHLVAHAGQFGIDPNAIAVSGDACGANMATWIALLAKDRRGPAIGLQLLLCPVSDDPAGYLSGETYGELAWFGARTARYFVGQVDASVPEKAWPPFPMAASLDQLNDLPPALVITAEFDVSRDAGESYARKLNEAGVRVTSVRYNGTIHQFMVLNALASTPAARAAIAQACATLRKSFGG